MPPRVPPIRATAQDLHFGRSPHRGQNCLNVRFYVINIDGAHFTVDILWTCSPNKNTCHLIVLLTRLTTVPRRARLKKAYVHKPTCLVARCSLKKTRQQVGTHVAHFRTDRVCKHCRIRTTTKKLSRLLVDEAISNGLVVPQSSGRAARCCQTLLHRCQYRLCNASHTRKRLADKLCQRRNPRNFLNQIRLALNVRTP